MGVGEWVGSKCRCGCVICVCVFMYEWVQVVGVGDGVNVSGCMGLWFAFCSPLESTARASRSASGKTRELFLNTVQWGSQLAFG